jgi:phosphopantetheinyl transferase
MFSRSVDVVVGDLATVDIDEDLLSVAELGRALELAQSELLNSYLLSHTWLHGRLAEYLGVGPAEIALVEDAHGKLTIATPSTDLSFDMSHSAGMAVLVVGFRVAVGVDVELVEVEALDEEVLRHTLTAAEVEAVQAAVNPVRAFAKTRARKGALAKALGGDVEIGSRLVRGDSPLMCDGLEVTDINLGDGFAAAVALPAGCRLELTTFVGAAA